MANVHISEAEAVRDFAGVLARVRAGEEIVIDHNNAAAVVVRSAELPRRSIEDSIARAEAYSRELGYSPVMDTEFAADLEEVLKSRKPRVSAWD